MIRFILTVIFTSLTVLVLSKIIEVKKSKEGICFSLKNNVKESIIDETEKYSREIPLPQKIIPREVFKEEKPKRDTNKVEKRPEGDPIEEIIKKNF